MNDKPHYLRITLYARFYYNARLYENVLGFYHVEGDVGFYMLPHKDGEYMAIFRHEHRNFPTGWRVPVFEWIDRIFNHDPNRVPFSYDRYFKGRAHFNDYARIVEYFSGKVWVMKKESGQYR